MKLDLGRGATEEAKSTSIFGVFLGYLQNSKFHKGGGGKPRELTAEGVLEMLSKKIAQTLLKRIIAPTKPNYPAIGT